MQRFRVGSISKARAKELWSQRLTEVVDALPAEKPGNDFLTAVLLCLLMGKRNDRIAQLLADAIAEYESFGGSFSEILGLPDRPRGKRMGIDEALAVREDEIHGWIRKQLRDPNAARTTDDAVFAAAQKQFPILNSWTPATIRKWFDRVNRRIREMNNDELEDMIRTQILDEERAARLVDGEPINPMEGD